MSFKSPKTVIAQYGLDGEILCKCKEPVVEFTVKKEGINKGRVFYKCSKEDDDEFKCKLFLWADEIKPPTTSQIAKFGSHRIEEEEGGGGGHRLGGNTPPPLSTPKKRKNTSSNSNTIVIDSDDDWEGAFDNDEEEDKPIASSSKGKFISTPSPTKKTKLDNSNSSTFSFAGNKIPSPPPSSSYLTSPSSKKIGTTSSEYDKILADPDSPFHKAQRALFPTTSTSSSNSTPTYSQTMNQDLMNSSGSSPSKSNSIDTGSHWDSLISNIGLLKKEDEKKERLLVAGKKRTAILDKMIAALKLDKTALEGKVRMLEAANEELRTRYE